MEWILNNKEWIFSGIGVLALTLIINYILKKNKTNSQTVIGGKGNTQSMENTTAETKQTIVGGSGNIQNTGTLNINSNNSKPKISIEIKTLGGASKPISSKFQVGGTGEKEFTWNYDVKIKNESKDFAYKVRLNFPNGSKFTSNSKSGNLGTIQPGKEVTINSKFVENKILSGFQMKKYREQKYPSSVREFLIRIDYENQEGDSFNTNLYINDEGKEEIT